MADLGKTRRRLTVIASSEQPVAQPVASQPVAQPVVKPTKKRAVA